jgi:hypothetical protein
MNHTPKHLQRRLKQSQTKIHGNARERGGFGSLATPAPTLPASLHECWNSIVGAGLSSIRIPISAGVKDKNKNQQIQIKNTDTAKVKSKVNGNGNTNTVENPPNNLLVMKQVWGAGFSTPFPEGGTLSGPLFFNLYLKEVDHGRS